MEENISFSHCIYNSFLSFFKNNVERKMKKEKCAYCKKDLDRDNPQFVLQELTSIGFVSFDFCDNDCLIRYIAKRFKRKIRKMVK